MATIKQLPNSLSLSGNILDIILTSSETVNFKILEGTETILEENYDPDENGEITIRLRDIIPTLLTVAIPTTNIYQQTESCKIYDFSIDGDSNKCKIIKGGVDASITAETFLEANWLTWQQQSKKVKYTDPEWLSYYSILTTNVKVKAYFKDADPEIITLTTFKPGNLYTINVNFEYLSSLFTSGQPVYFDIWTENSSGTRLSYIQRYILISDYFENEDIFIFANSLGGIDTVKFTGNKQETNTFEISTALFDEDTTDYDIDFTQAFTKNTGYSFSADVRAWWNDFFNSIQKYYLTSEGNIKSISISKPKAEVDPLKPSSFYYTFIFALSKQTKYLNLTRSESLPENVEIVDPDTEVFFLAPRLVDFPDAVIDPLLLIPVQEPFVQKWKKLSYGALRDAIVTAITDNMQDIIGSSHTHFNKEDLDKLTTDVGYLLINGTKTKAGDSDSLGGRQAADFYHKDNANLKTVDWSTQRLIASGDIKSPDYFAGKTGHKTTPEGDSEMNSLKLRDFLEVPELRYNRVSIYVGEQWRAPGGGIIESVNTENKIITLKLEDGEIGAVAVNDICMGIFHSLTSEENATENGDDGIGNKKFAGFSTSYFRVTEIVETSYNSQFKYELRPISDNYTAQAIPVKSMTFVAYGNFTDTDRQTSQYATTKYERYLSNVNGWEFNSNMIMAQFGDLSNLSLFGLDMTGYSAYLNNIYMSGTIKQFELTEPLRLEIDSSMGWMLGPGEISEIDIQAWKGWANLTDLVTKWEWTRDSGIAQDDEAWNISHTNWGGNVNLSYDDLGSTVNTNNSCLFTIIAYYEETGTIQTAKTTIEI